MIISGLHFAFSRFERSRARAWLVLEASVVSKEENRLLSMGRFCQVVPSWLLYGVGALDPVPNEIMDI